MYQDRTRIEKGTAMKRNRAVTAYLLFIAICIGCKPEKKAAVEKETQERRQVQPTEDTLSAEECGRIMAMLDAAILRVNAGNGETAKKRLVTASWDSVGGGFLCIGKGVVNPKLPSAAQTEAREKAARLTAERWALYLKKWRDGVYVSPTRGIGGEITYSRELCRRSDGDTLFLLLQVPLGSIVGRCRGGIKSERVPPAGEP